MSVKKAVLCGYQPAFAEVLNQSLRESGFEAELEERLDPALVSERSADVIFCSLSEDIDEKTCQDIVDAIQVLRITKEDLPIFCTSDGDNIERVVMAVKAGANDFQRWDGSAATLPRRLIQLAKSIPVAPAEMNGADPSGFQGILGRSAEIRGVFDLIEKVGHTSSTILINGESGTGKELVCRAIHQLSERANNLLIPVNCGAIPEELLESELFGHEKGAFTGATTSREGRFQMADGGTIFLDEITEMSPKLQVKLLRVIQECEFERVGGSRTIKIDVRIISATNRNLEDAVKEGTFREDLYYRLNVIPIHLPSLRERREDISLLIESFIERFRAKETCVLEAVHPDAMRALQDYPWPGNVRELENFIERMAILAEKPELCLEDLPERFRPEGEGQAAGDAMHQLDIPEAGIDLKSVIDSLETQFIEKALEKSGGVKNRAAQLLGLNRTTLVEKLKKKNIEATNGS